MSATSSCSVQPDSFLIPAGSYVIREEAGAQSVRLPDAAADDLQCERLTLSPDALGKPRLHLRGARRRLMLQFRKLWPSQVKESAAELIFRCSRGEAS